MILNSACDHALKLADAKYEISELDKKLMIVSDEFTTLKDMFKDLTLEWEKCNTKIADQEKDRVKLLEDFDKRLKVFNENTR